MGSCRKPTRIDQKGQPALFGTIAASLRGVPARVVGRHHSDLLHREHRPLHVGLDQLATGLSHAVIANSEFTRRVMVERESAPPAKVRVVYYGLDTEALVPAPPAAIAALRRELGLKEERFVIVVPARLDRAKGHEDLFDALDMLPSDRAARLAVLVAGDGPARVRFERRVQELGLKDVVRFLGHRRDIHLLYQAADLTALPSLSEAFGQVLIESLCFGTAVLATSVGGIPEIVEHERTGLLVEPADSRALARAILRYMDDRSLRERTAAAGRTRVRATFDSRQTAHATEAVYAELLGSTR